MTRRGVSAIELLMASAIMAAAFIPVYMLIQSSQQVAFLSEAELLARRYARRVACALAGIEYQTLRSHAKGDAPPADVKSLPPEGRRLHVALATPAEDVSLETAAPGMLDGYLGKTRTMRAAAYLHELEPGFARLAVLVSWTSPASKQPHSAVAVCFVEDPLMVGRSR